MRWFLALMIAASANAATLPAISDRPIAPVAYGPSRVGGGIRIASDGDGYINVWTNFRYLLASRIDGHGKVRDILPIYIASNPSGFDVAYSSGMYFVAWSDPASGHVLVRRIGTKNVILDAAPHDTGLTGAAQIIADGTHVAVVNTRFQPIGLDGAPIGRPTTLGSDFMHAVPRHDSVLIQLPFETTYRSVDWTGDAIGGGTFNGLSGSPQIAASDGNGFLVIAANSLHYSAWTLDANGNATGGPYDLFNANRASQALWDGVSYVVTAYDTDRKQVIGKRIPAAGGFATEFVLPDTIAPSQIATNGTTYVRNYSAFDVVSPTLGGTTDADVTVLPLQTAREQMSIAAASTPTTAAAVWLESNEVARLSIRAAFVTGTTISAPIDIDDDVMPTRPAIATDGGGFLLVYGKGDSATVRTLSTTGAIGAPHTLPANFATDFPSACSAAWDGTRYIVLADPSVATFDRSGVLLEQKFAGVNPLAVGAQSLACDANGCTIAYTALDMICCIGEVPLVGGIFARRLEPDLSISYEGRLTTADYTYYDSPVVGTMYQAAVYRNGADSFAIYPTASLYAARVPGEAAPPDTRYTPPGTLLGGTNVNTLTVMRNGLYWYGAGDKASAQPMWSRIEVRGVPALVNTTDLGDRIPIPVAATANATHAFVFYLAGQDDLSLFAQRIHVVTFANPDPYAIPQHHRAGGK